MGQAISLRVQSLRAQARKVVKQIETPCSPDPILRRPCADREEKRVTRESDTIRKRSDQKQLDPKTPIREDFSNDALRSRRGRPGPDLFAVARHRRRK